MIQEEIGRIVAVYRPKWKTRHQISCLAISSNTLYMALGTHQGYIILCKSQKESSLNILAKNNFNQRDENVNETRLGTLETMIPSFLLFDNFHCPLPVLDCVFIQWNYLEKWQPEQSTLLSLHQGGILKYWDLKSGRCIFSSLKFMDSNKFRIISLPDQRFSIIFGDEYIDLYDCWKDEVIGTLAHSKTPTINKSLEAAPDEFILSTLSSSRMPQMIRCKSSANKSGYIWPNYKPFKGETHHINWVDKTQEFCANDEFKKFFYSIYGPYLDSTSFEAPKTEPLIACLTQNGNVCCWNLFQVIEDYLETSESHISTDPQIDQFVLEKQINNYKANKQSKLRAYIETSFKYPNQNLASNFLSNTTLTCQIAITREFLIVNAFNRIIILKRSFGNKFEPFVDLFSPDDTCEDDSSPKKQKHSVLSQLWSGFEITPFSHIPSRSESITSKSETIDYKERISDEKNTPIVYINLLAWTYSGQLSSYKFSNHSTPTTKGYIFPWKVPRALITQLHSFPNLTRIEPTFDTNLNKQSNIISDGKSPVICTNESPLNSKPSQLEIFELSLMRYKIYFVEYPRNHSLMSYFISSNESCKTKLFNIQDIWDLGFDYTARNTSAIYLNDSPKSIFYYINQRLLSRAIVGVFAVAKSEIFLVLSFSEGYIISINLSSIGSSPQLTNDLFRKICSFQTLLDIPTRWNRDIYDTFNDHQVLKILPTVGTHISSRSYLGLHYYLQSSTSHKVYSTLKCAFNNLIVGGTTSGDVSIWNLCTNEIIDHFPKCHLSEIAGIFSVTPIDESLEAKQLPFVYAFITVDKSNHYILFQSKLTFEDYSSVGNLSLYDMKYGTTNEFSNNFSMRRLEHFEDCDNLFIFQMYICSSNDLIMISSLKELFLWRLSSGKFLKRVLKPAPNRSKTLKSLNELNNLSDIIETISSLRPISGRFGNHSIVQIEEMKVCECFSPNMYTSINSYNNLDADPDAKVKPNASNTPIEELGLISILILNVEDLISLLESEVTSSSDNLDPLIRNLLGTLLSTANTPSTFEEHTNLIHIFPLKFISLNRASIGAGNSLSITLSAFPMTEIQNSIATISHYRNLKNAIENNTLEVSPNQYHKFMGINRLKDYEMLPFTQYIFSHGYNRHIFDYYSISIKSACGVVFSWLDNIEMNQKIKPLYYHSALVKIFSSHDSTNFAIILDILCSLNKKHFSNMEKSRSHLAAYLLKHVEHVDIFRLTYNIIESTSVLLKRSSEYLIRNYFQNCLELDLENICFNCFKFINYSSQDIYEPDQLMPSFSFSLDLTRNESNIKTAQLDSPKQKHPIDVYLVTLSIIFHERPIYFRKLGNEMIAQFLESLVLCYLSERNEATNYTQLLCGLLADVCENLWDFNYFTRKAFVGSLKSSFRESQKNDFGEAFQYPLQDLGWFVLILFRDYRNILFSGPCGRILNAIYRRKTSNLIKIIGWICRSINMSESRSAALLLLLWLADREPRITYYHLMEIVDTIVKCLNPINVEIRKGSLASATAFFFHLVKRFPMVAVHQKSQRLALGNHTSLIIIFDLRTSTIHRVLEGHSGPISALSFIDDGDGIVSYCSQDKSIRTWKTTSSGVFGDLWGFSSPTVATLKLPAVKVNQDYKSPEKLFNLIRIEILNQKEMILQREDGKAYKIRLRRS